MKEDASYIQITFDEALKGLGSVSPNPLVGAVIVKNGKIISKGHHKKFGEAHAEINAMKAVSSEDLAGSTLYCNLEPCCHLNKKTPPCTLAIIKAKIKRVVVSNLDPNPEVSGRGMKELESAGIEVEQGILEDKGRELNRSFFHWIEYKKPFVHLKWAQSIDGRLALASGESKWISNTESRFEVHELRKFYDAVGVGRKTLVNDDAELTARDDDGKVLKVPYRVIFGDKQNCPDRLKVFQNNQDKNIFLSSSQSLEENLFQLGSKGITGILIEGGTQLISQFIEQELYQRVSIYIAPILLGNGPLAFESSKVKMMKDKIEFKKLNLRVLNGNWKLEGK